MLTVELKSLGRQVGPVVRYLNSQLDESLSVHGTQVKLTSTKARTAKLLLHKFSHQNGLENYRVVIVQPGLVEVLEPEKKKKHVQPGPASVFPRNETIPHYQVAAKWGEVPKPGRSMQ